MFEVIQELLQEERQLSYVPNRPPIPNRSHFALPKHPMVHGKITGHNMKKNTHLYMVLGT